MRGLAMSCAMLGTAAVAPAAFATTMTIPKGYEAVISNTLLGGCDANSYGYQVGTNQIVQVAAKPFDCSAGINEPDVTVGPVSTAQAFRLYLQDSTCNTIYYSDGTPVNHALVVDNGDGSFSVAIDDGGPGCPYASMDHPPSSVNQGNFDATVTMVAAPPTVTVTAPSAPAGQNGYFNPANLAGNGGNIPVTVSATDGTGSGMASISCTDNSASIPVTNVAGMTSPTMTGTVKVSANGVNTITCVAASAASTSGNTGGNNTATVKIDTKAPTLTVPSSPVVVPATSISGAQVSSYQVTASDADSGVGSIACSPAAPAQFVVGDTTVSCTASDKAGNTSSAGTFIVRVTPLPPPAASFGAVTTAGPLATVTVVCQGATGQTCSGTLTATSHETARGSSIIATAAATGTTTTNVVVGQAAFSVPAGSSSSVTLVLNTVAAELLGRLYVLNATLALPGGPTHVVTFRYGRIASPVLFTANFSPGSTMFSSLSATFLPRGATVSVTCPGCPRHGRTFKPKGRTVNLTKVVKGKRFRPGARITVTITAANKIGQVSVIQIRSGKQPSYTKLCLAPRAKRPSRCHK